MADSNHCSFHFDTAAGGGAVQPCEAAYIGSLNPARSGSAKAPPVTVLVLYVLSIISDGFLELNEPLVRRPLPL